MFVHRRADNRCGDGDSGIPAPGNSARSAEDEMPVFDGHGAGGWSCPHCAVENFRAARDGGDLAECDYCGRAFAMPV
jgi:hypothetical protein